MEQSLFVSSTCYDLIDARAELESIFKEMLLLPRLSDRLSSHFDVDPTVDSIQSCLANVEKSDFFVIILSQRYGPSLKKAGYEDLSATHLEYRRARELQKPIYMYVRQALWNEYELWRNNGKDATKLKFNWLADNKDHRLFEVIEEHVPLTEGANRSNWISKFEDSVELKRFVQRDFHTPAGVSLLRKLITERRVPLIVPEIPQYAVTGDRQWLHMQLHVTNLGHEPALKPAITVRTDGVESVRRLGILAPNGSATFKFEVRAGRLHAPMEKTICDFECIYGTQEGHVLTDRWQMSLPWNAEPGASVGIEHTHHEKQYHGSHFFNLKA